MNHDIYAAFLADILAQVRRTSRAGKAVHTYFSSQFEQHSGPVPTRSNEGDEDLGFAFEWCETADSMSELLVIVHELIERRDDPALKLLSAYAAELLDSPPEKIPSQGELNPASIIQSRVWCVRTETLERTSHIEWMFDYPSLEDDEIYHLPTLYPRHLFSRYIQATYELLYRRDDTVELVFLPAAPER
ncbi:hypothetical protein [Brevibacterium picturae]|uniref:Uncharacterized protein n=1 Tax=Brevibacterium picturae TaxID=260553 RepID=A0ABN2CSG5_9MICO